MSPTPILRLARLANTTARSTRSLQASSSSSSSYLPSTSTRTFSTTPLKFFPRKDSQHKDSINTEATEYSKSGTDDAAAREESAAFNPNVTSPEGAKEEAGKGKGKGNGADKGGENGNPLDVSPANREVSKTRGEQEGGAERSPGDRNTSGERGSGFGGGKKGGKRG